MTNEMKEAKFSADAQKPGVSVIIPLYNHERFIEEAIQSVLAQTYENFELVIINDGSTDNSGEVVRGIYDKRIKYFSQDNLGAPDTINRGIQLARGEFISILNSDDMYDTHRLEECIKILENGPSLSAVFSHLEFIDGEGKFIKYLRGAEENWADHSAETSFKGERNIVLDLLAGNFLTTTSNLFCRKDTFDKVGYFSNLRYAHDYDFFLRLCYHQKVQIIEKPLVKYRVHDLNTVKENEAEVDFEVGLILANFFLNYDVHKYFEGENGLYEIMMKFVGSINTYNADRMLATLFLFVTKYPEIKNDILAYSIKSPDNRFRNACIAHFKKNIDAWNLWKETNDRLVENHKELKEGWTKWKETNDRLTAKDKELNDRLAEKDKELKEGWTTWKETNDRLLAREMDLKEGWTTWKETNDRLIVSDKELMEAHEGLAATNERLAATNERLAETNKRVALANKMISEKEDYIRALQNSRSYRLGRFLTWPLRKLRGRY